MDYHPRPIDTSDVSLPPDLQALAEGLAEHAHDLWAQRRMSNGWKFGHCRDDVAKRHPSLVSYSELSEDEKEYDRAAVLGTLRAVLALGYTIVRPKAP